MACSRVNLTFFCSKCVIWGADCMLWLFWKTCFSQGFYLILNRKFVSLSCIIYLYWPNESLISWLGRVDFMWSCGEMGIWILRTMKSTKCRSQWPSGLRRIAFWECCFESLLRCGCLSLVSVLCCQVEVSATGRSLVQRSHADSAVSELMWLGKPQLEEAYAHESCWVMKKK
jgi:hypothetical protein